MDTTTIEYVPDVVNEGPAVLVHTTTGPYHTQDNPGECIAYYGTGDGVTDRLTIAQIAAITGLTTSDLTPVSDGHADLYVVA